MKVKVTMYRTTTQELDIVVDVPDTKDWIATANRVALDASFNAKWSTTAINQPEIRRTSKRNIE